MISLSRDLAALVLTNAMRPMAKCRPALLRLRDRYGERQFAYRSTLRAPCPRVGTRQNAAGSRPSPGIIWLARNGFSLHVASRRLSGESEAAIRSGFAGLFAKFGVAIHADDPAALMIFPEMDMSADVLEITEACWSILGESPESIMCANSRMIVKRKGAARPAVEACTLLPYDPRFLNAAGSWPRQTARCRSITHTAPSSACSAAALTAADKRPMASSFR
jgi:hypothetical protein